MEENPAMEENPTVEEDFESERRFRVVEVDVGQYQVEELIQHEGYWSKDPLHHGVSMWVPKYATWDARGGVHTNVSSAVSYVMVMKQLPRVVWEG